MFQPITSAWIIDQGKALGFDKVGIAPAVDLEDLSRLPEWLEHGFAGEMRYLHNPKRTDIRKVMPEAFSVICCALPYDTALPRSTLTPLDPERGWISRYAWGQDYHNIIAAKLEALREQIAARAGADFLCKLYVDTGPVLERVYARHAGLGWQAKNTCLIDLGTGSFFFLGLLVTNLPLEIDPGSPPPDQCGACTLCIEACPTGALNQPYVLDARRCISYLTIELRGSIPVDLRKPIGRHVFGCDICQDVCPWNDKNAASTLPEFQPRSIETRKEKTEKRETRAAHTAPSSQTEGHESLFHPHLNWLAGLSEEEFKETFRGNPVKRAKWRGLIRNTLIAMGNSGNPAFRPVLEKFAATEDALLAEHARWALKQFSG